MHWLADFAYLLAGIAYLPVILYQAIFLRKNRRGWGQRFGRLPELDRNKPRIWIHAVSLGEINATPRLVEALRAGLPEFEIVFSTTTDTGYARGVQLYGTHRVFRFPIDFSFVVKRVLRRIRPAVVVLVELEVWYNLVTICSRLGIPVAVVNGRLTERSCRRLRRLAPLIRPMFARLAWVGAQDEPIAERFRRLGVAPERIDVFSSLKWDSAQIGDHVAGAAALAAAIGLDSSEPLWVCGSTGPGEEAIVLEAYRRLRQGGQPAPLPRLVLVPRKPERFDDVARLIESAGFPCIRRSARPDGVAAGPLPPAAIILGDTMGELRKFYSLAAFVFVGRTLVPLGGSDPMEVAALGKPMIVGPYVSNFESPLRALVQVRAAMAVDSPQSLAETVRAFCADPAAASARGRAGREVVLQNQGATEKTADRLIQLLQPATCAESDLGSVARSTSAALAAPAK